MTELDSQEELVGSLQALNIENIKICDEVNIKDESKIAKEEKPVQYNKTGLVYDVRMSKYMFKQSHPERPERILRIYDHLLETGLVDKCVPVVPRSAMKDEILLKHNEKHYHFIQSVVNKTDDELEIFNNQYESIYFHPATTECAMLAAGCTLELVQQVLSGKILNGAAVIRPPGHHALNNCSMGFCHFNNVALAAMMAITKYNLKRVLIVDWDVHYGNGTHKMFEDDPRVLYFSLHRYDNQQFWPSLTDGNFDQVGIGEGEGYNIHVAWNKNKIRDCEYLYAFDNLLVPIATEYDPELILVSCGFDSGDGDPLGRCKVTPVGYAHMTKKLMQFAGGKIAVILEGGYNLNTLATSMESVVATLLGNPVAEIFDKEPCDKSPLQSIINTFFVMLKYWKSLAPLHEKFKKLQSELQISQEPNNVESSSSDEDDDELNEFRKF